MWKTSPWISKNVCLSSPQPTSLQLVELKKVHFEAKAKIANELICRDECGLPEVTSTSIDDSGL